MVVVINKRTRLEPVLFSLYGPRFQRDLCGGCSIYFADGEG